MGDRVRLLNLHLIQTVGVAAFLPKTRQRYNQRPPTLGNLDVNEIMGLSQPFGILRAVPFIMIHEMDTTRGVKRKELKDN